MDREILLEILKSFTGSPALQVQPCRYRQWKLRLFRYKLSVAKAEIYAALAADIGRDTVETLLAELIPLTSIIDYLAREDIPYLYPCHCTALAVKVAMGNDMHIEEVGTGVSLEWV